MTKGLFLFSALVLFLHISAFAQAPGIEWAYCYGGPNNDNANCIIQTKDSGYIVAGSSNSNTDNVSNNHGGEDFWVVKLKSNGAIDWSKTYGGSGDEVA